MTALKGAAIAAFMRQPDLKRRAFLVYGPDSGLVSEYVGRLVETCLGGRDDPFALVRLDADILGSEPSRVSDELATIGMFGGARVVWLRAANMRIDGKALVASLQPSIAARSGGYLVVEAGELSEKSPLRRLFDTSTDALALACYADGPADILRLIDDEMREAGLSIGATARDGLAAQLGGDRIASRQEVRKLALYCHGQSAVSDDDVLAICGDVSSLAIDAVIDAMGLGDRRATAAAYQRLIAEDTDPNAIVALALRHMLQLYLGALDMDRGRSARDVRDAQRPPVFFKRANAFERQLQLWPSPRAGEAHRVLTQALLDVRRNFAMAATIGERALLRVASMATSA